VVARRQRDCLAPFTPEPRRHHASFASSFCSPPSSVVRSEPISSPADDFEECSPCLSRSSETFITGVAPGEACVECTIRISATTPAASRDAIGRLQSARSMGDSCERAPDRGGERIVNRGATASTSSRACPSRSPRKDFSKISSSASRHLFLGRNHLSRCGSRVTAKAFPPPAWLRARVRHRGRRFRRREKGRRSQRA